MIGRKAWCFSWLNSVTGLDGDQGHRGAVTYGARFGEHHLQLHVGLTPNQRVVRTIARQQPLVGL